MLDYASRSTMFETKVYRMRALDRLLVRTS